MRRLGYTLLFYLLLPLMFMRLWRRGASLPAYRQRWAERLGLSLGARPHKPVLWFHTVSVGEFIAAKGIIGHYLEREDLEILITTTTPTGSERVHAAFEGRVLHCYLPYDLPGALRRFLKHFQPQAFVCLETELWPNLLHACASRDIPVILANARLSEKSAAGYRRFKGLTRGMLSAITEAAIQNSEDAQRFIELGLPETRCHVSGNIKFDLKLSDALIAEARQLHTQLSDHDQHTVWIAASTHKGEDELILDAFLTLRETHPNTRLLLVPRHPERFDSVVALSESRGSVQGLTVHRRSLYAGEPFDILVGDTMGELLLLLGASDIAFIGGSLVDNGGHNYIEPAAWAMPILSGPSTFNFREIAAELIQQEALTLVSGADALAEQVARLSAAPQAAAAMGARAKQVAERNRGASLRLFTLIDRHLKPQSD